MSEPDNRLRDIAAAAPGGAGRLSAAEWVAAGLSLIWVAAVAAYVYSDTSGTGALGLVLTLLVVFLPLALIWTSVITLRSGRALRAEAARLQASFQAMRPAFVAQQQGAALRPSVERKLDEIDAVTRHTETAIASFNSRRDASLTQPSADRRAALVPPPRQPETDEPGLALGTPAEALRVPITVADFVRAVQFPESADDKEGFRALRLALEDRTVAKLIRAAQDVLTLLSQEGIYMDDLKPDRARPELWRRFAQGERGRGIAALGGVRDRSSLALTGARMREDPIFRDAAHHFLRSFDRVFSEFEKEASDAEISAFADTRTARAFMLFGRVTGTFD